jgi:hypothetical protein
MEVLLEQRGDHLPVTADIVEDATMNRLCGHKVLSLLLEHGSDSLLMSRDVFYYAGLHPKCEREITYLRNAYTGYTLSEGINNHLTIPLRKGHKVI